MDNVGGLALANVACVAQMLHHLATWVNPETWEEWVLEYGIPNLIRHGVLASADDLPTMDALASALRFTYASFN